MHLPERWGVLHFSDGQPGSVQPAPLADWALRQTAMAVYYAEKAFASANNGTYAANVSALASYVAYPFADPRVIDGTCTGGRVPTITLAGPGRFNVTVTSADGHTVASVLDDRLLRVWRA